LVGAGAGVVEDPLYDALPKDVAGVAAALSSFFAWPKTNAPVAEAAGVCGGGGVPLRFPPKVRVGADAGSTVFSRSLPFDGSGDFVLPPFSPADGINEKPGVDVEAGVGADAIGACVVLNVKPPEVAVDFLASSVAFALVPAPVAGEAAGVVEVASVPPNKNPPVVAGPPVDGAGVEVGAAPNAKGVESSSLQVGASILESSPPNLNLDAEPEENESGKLVFMHSPEDTGAGVSGEAASSGIETPLPSFGIEQAGHITAAFAFRTLQYVHFQSVSLYAFANVSPHPLASTFKLRGLSHFTQRDSSLSFELLHFEQIQSGTLAYVALLLRLVRLTAC